MGQAASGHESQPAAAHTTAQHHWQKEKQTASYRFRAFGDKYRNLQQVTEVLRTSGLESSELVIGVDFTKSNEWTGKQTFGGKCLHHVSSTELNPYEQAISIIGRTLAPFDDDDLIPVYGFGDHQTHDSKVFSFNSRDRPFHGFGEVITRYREIASNVRLSGPTSFAPIIRQATALTAQDGQYHILLIIADGQVTRPSDTPANQYSIHEQDTVDAIVEASKYPLSIVLVGVGDGPWETMRHFDDQLPHRVFDNFQFVEFAKVMAPQGSDGTGVSAARAREARFALHALMEIPDQYKAIQHLRLGKGRFSCQAPLEPPRIAAGTAVPTAPPLTASTRHLFNASAAGAGGAAAGARGAGLASIPAAAPAAAAAQWTCATCTLVNDSGNFCGACGSAKPAPAPVPVAPPANWVCGACGSSNPGNFCSGCGKPRPAAPTTAPAAAPAVAVPDAVAAQGTAALRSALQPTDGTGGGGDDDNTCPVCLDLAKDMVFQCGHQVCSTCGPTLNNCPICRASVTARIKIYG